jgi:hypothetical protein
VRLHALRLSDDRRDETVATLMDCLYIAGGSRVIAESPAKLGYGAGQDLVANDNITPYLIQQDIAGEHIPRLRCELNQQLHNLGLELPRLTSRCHSVQSRLNKPITDLERPVVRQLPIRLLHCPGIRVK